jgi:hypothetical protein
MDGFSLSEPRWNWREFYVLCLDFCNASDGWPFAAAEQYLLF